MNEKFILFLPPKIRRRFVNAKKAHIYSKNGKIIAASDCTIKDVGKKFYCSTEKCYAEMSLVNAANPLAAYFRSKDKSKHISNKCIKNSIQFNDSDYDESRFDLNFALDSMLGDKHSIKRGTTGSSTGSRWREAFKDKYFVKAICNVYFKK
jgi:hypothetical protein